MSELEQLHSATALDYDSSKPALLFGNAAAIARAEPSLAAAGVRLVDRLSLESASQRLDEQLSLGLVWLELDASDGGPGLERLLDRIDEMAVGRGVSVVVAAPLSLIDTVAARLTARSTEILIDPDEAQRVAALATSLSGALGDSGVRDVGKDNAARLRQLSDEMGRIASTLARLSSGPGGEPSLKAFQAGAPPLPLEAEVVRSVIRARRLRSRFFSEELFADPAWDMLLDLLQAEISQLRVPVSSLCIAAAVPATTALRWIKTMTEQGLFVRRADPHDGRRVFVELAPAASEAMRRYFADIDKPAVI